MPPRPTSRPWCSRIPPHPSGTTRSSPPARESGWGPTSTPNSVRAVSPGRRCGECGSLGTPTDGAPATSYVVVEVNGSSPEVSLRRVTYEVKQACAGLQQTAYPYATVHDSVAKGRDATVAGSVMPLEGVPPVRVVVLCLDGTLLRHDQSVSPWRWAALHR